MSSFLASVRKLFAKEDAEGGEPEAKRTRLEEPASSSSAASSSSSNLDGRIPADYAARLNALTQIGWQPRFAAKALQTYQFDVAAAAAALQKAHPITSQPVAAMMEVDEEPTKFERLLPLPRNNVSITPSTSIAPASASSSSASSSQIQLHSPPSSPLLAPAAAVPLTYECTACTFVNDVDSNRCEICLEPRHLTQQQSAVIASTVECAVCFVHQPSEMMFEPAAASACKHYICVEDARLYLESRVDQGQVTGAHMKCVACPRELSTAEIKAGLDDAGFARYSRFRRLHELSNDPSVIFCPSATCEIALFHTKGDKLTCPDCRRSVCFACKVPWHAGLTCAGYRYAESLKSEQQKLASLSASERLFQRFLERNQAHFKQCRKCTSWVEKSEGCDKMTCRCGERWCQKCGVANATCQCTGSNHIFYSQEHVLNNFGRPSGRPREGAPAAGPFGLPGLLQSLMYSSSASGPPGRQRNQQQQ